MDLITVDISEFRNRLSDYLTLVNLRKATVNIRNAKSGKEVVRIISPIVDKASIEIRKAELFKLAGFASNYPLIKRKKFTKMGIDYIKKLKRNKTE